jgi:segregation and condensation protein A
LVTFSVEEKMAELRDRLRSGRLAFDELFAAVTSRLEAVACFLALLELLRLGEAVVEQEEPFGPISVRAGG